MSEDVLCLVNVGIALLVVIGAWLQWRNKKPPRSP